MASKYLDKNGLVYLWKQIQHYFGELDDPNTRTTGRALEFNAAGKVIPGHVILSDVPTDALFTDHVFHLVASGGSAANESSIVLQQYELYLDESGVTQERPTSTKYKIEVVGDAADGGVITATVIGNDEIKISADLSAFALSADTVYVQGLLTGHTTSAQTTDDEVHLRPGERSAWSASTVYVNASANTWNDTVDKVTASASTWNTTTDQVTASASTWNTTADKVTASASTWNTTTDQVNASGQSWNNVVDHAVTAVTVDNKSIVTGNHAAKIVTGSGVTSDASGNVIANLKDYTANAVDSTKSSTGTVYPVELDKSGKLAVTTPDATVIGVDANDKILTLDNKLISSTLGIDIQKVVIPSGPDSGETHTFLTLTGKDVSGVPVIVASADTSEFVVNGILEDVSLSGSTLVFTWNTSEGTEVTYVDLAEFIDDYISGSGITINGGGRVVNVKLSSTQDPRVKLDFNADSGLTAKVELSGYTLSATTTWIDSRLTAHTENGDIHVTAQQKTDWQTTTDQVNESASTWNSTADKVTASASTWNTTTDKVTASASTWNTTTDKVNASGQSWNDVVDHAITAATLNGIVQTVTGNHRLDITAVTKVSTSDGITGGDITTSGTVKADLVSYTKDVSGAVETTDPSNTLLPVKLDKDGKLAVKAPVANNGKLTIAVSGDTTASGSTTVKEFTANQTGDTSVTLVEARDAWDGTGSTAFQTATKGHDIEITPDATNGNIIIGANIWPLSHDFAGCDIDEAITAAENGQVAPF